MAVDHLTNRENEVLALLADGMSNQQIREALFITQRTVEHHINSLFSKLGFGNGSEGNPRVMAARTYWDRTR